MVRPKLSHTLTTYVKYSVHPILLYLMQDGLDSYGTSQAVLHINHVKYSVHPILLYLMQDGLDRNGTSQAVPHIRQVSIVCLTELCHLSTMHVILKRPAIPPPTACPRLIITPLNIEIARVSVEAYMVCL